MPRILEYTVHRELICAYLERPETIGGLGWTADLAAHVQPDGLIHPESLYRFLSHGNNPNESAWKALVREAGDQNQAKNMAVEAVRQAISNADTTVQVIRSGVRVGKQAFSLWNPRHTRGGLQSQCDLFDRNERVTTAEMTIVERMIHGTGKRRPDQAFHLNGLLYALTEVKAKQTGQSASDHGRRKLAADFRAFAFGALKSVRDEFEMAERSPWPGIGVDWRRLNLKWKNKVTARMSAYSKGAWMAVMDMDELWLAPDPWKWISLCDATLGAMLEGRFGEARKALPNSDQDSLLAAAMVAGFSRMPDIQGVDNSWQGIQAHLEGLLSGSGIAREVNFWHHPVERAGNKISNRRAPNLHPRAPQRVALQQTMSFVRNYYAHEQEAGWAEQDLRDRLMRSLPAMNEADIARVISDRLKYRNGQDAYSVLIQGAAGLGKSNIAVWLAIELHGELKEWLPGENKNLPQKELFDRVVILTDRVQLRENIAEEAARSTGSRGQVLEVEDQPTLAAALTGEPLPNGQNGANILVVNLQKFPSLQAVLKAGNKKVKHIVGRTAFIIDEVHRSQNGDLNETTLNTFLDEMSELASGGQQKKNLIIGLTATPSDPILARFGQWRPGVGAADTTRWVPHFAYGMKQAIIDRYVHDPLKGLLRLNVPLDIHTTETLNKAHGASKVVIPMNLLYENKDRQQLVAKRFSEIFVSNTMLAMPYKQNTTPVGRGKAMITVHSIRAAISMANLVRDSLMELAANAAGKSWAGYAHIIKEVAEKRVLVLFSNPGTSQDTRLGECGLQNMFLKTVSPPNEKEIVDAFKCKGAGKNNAGKNSIIIVVDKLLTGFDEPTLHTLLIDRSLHGIGLFQAVCRVNRTTEGKTGCLVVVSCHDEKIIDETRRVFVRYGGIATSDLDGLDLLERVKGRRRKLLRWDGLKLAWKGKRVLTSAEQAEERHEWVEKIKAKPEQAFELRCLMGGYLADQRLAKPLMRLERDDLDEDWLSFIQEIRKMLLLFEASDEDRVVDIAFDVLDIGMDDLAIPDMENLGKNEVMHAPTGIEGMVADWDEKEPVSVDNLLDQIDRMRLIEEAKAIRVTAVRAFIQDLFSRIDALSVANNNDSFRKELYDPNQTMEYTRAMKWFAQLFDSATGDRNWIDKTDADKRRYRDLARGRLDLLLGDYRMR